MQILPTDKTSLAQRICRQDFSVHTCSGDNSLIQASMLIAVSTYMDYPFSTCTCKRNCSLIPLQHCDHAYPQPCMSHQAHHICNFFCRSLFDIRKKHCTLKTFLQGEPRQGGHATSKIETNACFSPCSLHPHSTSAIYRRRRASRSDSRSTRMSPSRTGPFTLRMIDR